MRSTFSINTQYQVSQLLALSLCWFVYSSWWAVALNLSAAVVTAQVATRSIWALAADRQRKREQVVAFVSCIVFSYWLPMGLQAGQDVLAWLRSACLTRGSTTELTTVLTTGLTTKLTTGFATELTTGLTGATAATAAPSLAVASCALGTLVSLVIGGLLYASGLPERAFPGVFDVVGFSHQLMHVAAAAAHAFEFAFVLEMWGRRRLEWAT